MFDGFRHRIHPREVLFNAIERTFLTSSAMVVTLVLLLILFIGIYTRLV